MKTKKWILCLGLISCIESVTVAQHKNGLKCFGLMGVQLNDQQQTFNTGLTAHVYGFTTGMGIEYHEKRFLAGTEFFGAYGGTTNTLYKLDYTGYSSMAYVGVNLLPDSRCSLAPYAGVGMSLNKNTISRKDQTFTEVLSKNQLAAVIALKYEYSWPSGIFIGIRSGYNYGFFANTNWQNEVTLGKSNFKNPANSFFLNASFGLHLKLPSKTNPHPVQ